MAAFERTSALGTGCWAARHGALSGSEPCVAMVETADLRQRHDPLVSRKASLEFLQKITEIHSLNQPV
jgi:hypothetical protein